jgi:hypothetical protein
MSKLLRGRVSSAHLIATVALVAALGGSAYAVSKAPKNSVTSKSVVNKSLRGKDVKPGSIAGTQVDDDSLTGADVTDDSLTDADVSEQSLGQVPDAAKLGGQGPGSFMRRGIRLQNRDLVGGDPVDFTPDVSGLGTLVLDYNVPTVLGGGGATVFTGGAEGQRLTVVSRDQSIIFTATSQVHVAGGSWGGSTDDTITLVFADGEWYEVARSTN